MHGRVAQVALPFFYIPPTMLRLFLASFLCAVFMACSSSDESTALSQWFSDQGLATSYGVDSVTIDVSVKFTPGFDTSAYLVGSHGVLGDVNGMEHALYFGFGSSVARDWALRPDTVFYNRFYEGTAPNGPLAAKVYWLKEDPSMDDASWMQFDRPWLDSADISIDNFSFSLPEAVPDDILLIGLKLKAGSNLVLRIETKSIAEIPGLARVAQKTKLTDDCSQCLHAGVRESLVVSIMDKINIDKAVVFAELLLYPERADIVGSELGYPLPVYVYNSEREEESYMVDTVYAKNYGHPNLVFREGDTLKLQVTKSMRKGLTDSLTLWLGYPVLLPQSSRFYDHYDENRNIVRVFADRPAYAKYDFSAFETAQLRLWFADYGDKK